MKFTGHIIVIAKKVAYFNIWFIQSKAGHFSFFLPGVNALIDILQIHRKGEISMSIIPLVQLQNFLKEQIGHFFRFDQMSGSYYQQRSYFEQGLDSSVLTMLPADGIPVECFGSYINILFCDGPAVVSIGDQKIACFAGNIVLIRNECPFKVEPESRSAVYLAMYKKEMFDNLFYSQIADCPIIHAFFSLSNSQNEFLYFDCDSNMPIQHFAKALQLELVNTDDLSHKTVLCSTVLFMSNLNRVHRANLVITESSMMKENLIGHILKYMAEHYDTATLTSTAEHFNYHPVYFSTMFQKKALCSFTTKMQELRLEQARRFLASTEFSIQHICDSIGFHDRSYFYRCFKAAYGMTPSEYRKKYRWNRI